MTYTTEILHDGKIQFWHNGIMLGVVSHRGAIAMVDSGAYRVINNQAIEQIIGA